MLGVAAADGSMSPFAANAAWYVAWGHKWQQLKKDWRRSMQGVACSSEAVLAGNVGMTAWTEKHNVEIRQESGRNRVIWMLGT